MEKEIIKTKEELREEFVYISQNDKGAFADMITVLKDTIRLKDIKVNNATIWNYSKKENKSVPRASTVKKIFDQMYDGGVFNKQENINVVITTYKKTVNNQYKQQCAGAETQKKGIGASDQDNNYGIMGFLRAGIMSQGSFCIWVLFVLGVCVFFCCLLSVQLTTVKMSIGVSLCWVIFWLGLVTYNSFLSLDRLRIIMAVSILLYYFLLRDYAAAIRIDQLIDCFFAFAVLGGACLSGAYIAYINIKLEIKMKCSKGRCICVCCFFALKCCFGVMLLLSILSLVGVFCTGLLTGYYGFFGIRRFW